MTLELSTFAWIHTLISLVPLLAGIVVVANLMKSEDNAAWTTLFFVTAIATNVTGFGFPFHQFLPSHGVAIISLIVLFAALAGRYLLHLEGHGRWIYVVGVVAGLYFDYFVLIAQAFNKVNVLRAMAPTQSEPPFAIAQGVLLVIFLIIGYAAVKAFRPGARGTATA